MNKIITKAKKMVNVIIGLQDDLEKILIGLLEFDNDCECSYGYSHEINQIGMDPSKSIKF